MRQNMTKHDKLIASHDSAHHHSVIRELWRLSGENGKLLVTCYGSELHKHVLSNLASVLQPRGPVVWWSVVRGPLPPAAPQRARPNRVQKGAEKCRKVQNSSYIADLPQPLALFPPFPHVQFSMNQ